MVYIYIPVPPVVYVRMTHGLLMFPSLPHADPTLTINNLCLVTKSVENWYRLGRYAGGLDVPRAVCDEIRDSTAYQTDEERKEALLLYYLNTVPMASWPSVAGALHYNEEMTASKAVKKFLKDARAGQSSDRDYRTVVIVNKFRGQFQPRKLN